LIFRKSYFHVLLSQLKKVIILGGALFGAIQGINHQISKCNATRVLDKGKQFSLSCGIVAEKSIGNYALFSSTRLGLVYSMADILSDALAATLWQKHGAMPRKTTPAAPKTTASAPCATLSPAAVNAHLGATNE
jgi:hypothetical protein